MQTLTAEIAVDVRSDHAEGPVWDAERAAIVWVDQYAGVIRAAHDGRTIETLELPGGERERAIGAIVPAASGGWVASVGDGLIRIGRDGRREPIATVLASDAVPQRMNDGKVDPHGRLWFGTIAWDKRPGAASLYLLEEDRVTEALIGVTISNGLAWTPDGRGMFYIDTPTHEVRRFTVEEAAGGARLRDEGVAFRIPDAAGGPDGMCIDDEGCLWVALWGGSAVQRYSPSGELLARVEVDAPQVSSCCFGGPDLTTLFITTSQEGYSPADSAAHPGAGYVFSVDAGVSGPLPDAYAG